MIVPCKIVLLDKTQQKDARKLSQETGFLIQDEMDDNCFCLVYDKTIRLFAPKIANLLPLSLSFNTNKIIHHYQSIRGYQQNIAKAIGIKSWHKPLVLDATAGLAQDALLIASLGCKVLMIERNLIIAELLKSALKLGSRLDKLNQIIRKNLTLSVGDVNKITIGIKPEVVYLDPMFPENHRRRKPSRTMQYFRAIIDEDNDTENLFLNAQQLSPKRIVVKRSVKDGFILNQKPSHQIIGKTTRYDVYL